MLFALFTLLLSGLAAQNALPQLSPRPLKVSSIRKLEVPPFGAFGQTHCDDDLSMYDHLATGSYKKTVILRTALSGNESTLYKLPDEFADSTAFTDFSVTPDGSVTALVEDEKGHSIRFDFASEGNVSSHAQLDLPDQVAGDKIAVFPNGTMLFSGHYRRGAPPDLKGKRYLGLFQSSGKLLRRVNEAGMGDIDLDPPAHHIPEGAITIGKDGNAYLLGSDKVYAISASGQIQKKIPLAKPDGGFSAMGVQYSEGLLVVSFATEAMLHPFAGTEQGSRIIG
ncbi:MAG TPA: hypothetical protein VHW72_16350 [Candidatus Angelobacter sp.]|jgi:hypothetical protein|nr:hypothetical protein [Candidatus Angelobacter sp.]